MGRGTLLVGAPDAAVIGAGGVAVAEARYLGPGERKLLDECQPGRTVGEVLGGGWDDAEQVRQMLYAFSCLGLITLSPAAVAAPAAQPSVDDDYAPFTLEEPAPAAFENPAEPPPFELPETPPAAGGDFQLPHLEGLSQGAPAEGAGGAGGPAAGDLSFESPDSSGTFDMFSSDGLPSAPASPAARPAAKSKPSAKSRRLPHIPRLLGVALGALAALAVIGGGAWWWFAGQAPPPPPVKPPLKKALPPPPPSPATAPPAPAPPAPAAPAPAAPAPPAAAPSGPAVAASAGGSATDRYRNGLEVFRAGDLGGAAAVWESLLAEQYRGAFTLQLLTACQGETIRDAQRTLAPREIYLVTRKVHGRECFRLCLGVWPTRDEAARALAALPAEYKAAGASVRPVADALR